MVGAVPFALPTRPGRPTAKREAGDSPSGGWHGSPSAHPVWQHAPVTWVLDCDGVIWLADEPIPGAATAVRRLRESGERVAFLTNNSWHRVAEQVDKLRRMSIEASAGDVVSSSMAAASLVEEGERVLLVGGPGVREELERRGATVLEPGEGELEAVTAVVVGMDLGFSFQRLAAAATVLRTGTARLVATNDDATFPTAHGLLPGAGSIVAAVATAGGVEPVVAGKPHEAVARIVRERFGQVSMMVGDRPSTDGRFARLLEVRFGLVLTGVTPHGHGELDPAPDVEAPDLLTLVERVLADPGPSRESAAG
jgi:glycerol 3-phosphatase-2